MVTVFKPPESNTFSVSITWYLYLYWIVSLIIDLYLAIFHRELRLRRYLGSRYDAIPNVFDWDYNMKLVDKGVSMSSGLLINTLAPGKCGILYFWNCYL